MGNTLFLPSGVRSIHLRFTALILLVAFAPTARAADSYVAIAVETSSAATQIPNEYQPGAPLTLTVITRPYPTGALQWLHDDQPLPGATTLRLSLPHLSAADVGNYRLRITSESHDSYSNTVVVNVLPATLSPVDTSFTSQLPAGFSPTDLRAFAQDGSFIVELNSGTTALRLNSDGSLAPGERLRAPIRSRTASMTAAISVSACRPMSNPCSICTCH